MTTSTQNQSNAMDEDAPKKQAERPKRSSTPIASTSFYGESTSAQLQKATPIPIVRKRKSTAGSSHTTYLPPSTAPPQAYKESWREPELVADDDIPTITPFDPTETHESPQQSWTGAGGGWQNTTTNDWGGGGYDAWNPDMSNLKNAWSYDPFKTAKVGAPPIDNRNLSEEKNWWDPQWMNEKRPGPGLLPPLLAEKLHNPEHSLFMISVTQPDIKSNDPQPSALSTAASGSTTPSPPRSSQSSSPPPSAQEVLEAVPHPNAYYCRRHNGWVLLAWKSSSIPPPLVDSFVQNNKYPLPDQDKRKRTHSCLEDQPFGLSNKTHHFHYYEKAVDAAHLNPRFVRKAWEIVDQAKKTRRKVTLNLDDASQNDVLLASQGDVKVPLEAAEGDDASRITPDLLDLYMCCQCSFYVVVSDVIPGVIPSKYMEDLTVDKFRNPAVGRTPEQSVVGAWESLLSIIENRLWKGEHRGLSVSGKAFTTKLGWSPTTQKMFNYIGFTVGPGPGPETGISLLPPAIHITSEEGRANREKLLRAWVEIQAYLLDYHRRFPNFSKEYVPRRSWIKAESARETYQNAIGAHHDQLPRGGLPVVLEGWQHLDDMWQGLGMTKTSYEKELLQFAYLAQCRCDPVRTTEYFSLYKEIVSSLRTIGDCPPELEDLLVEEHSRGRFSKTDLDNAIKTLGFGADNELKLEFDEDLDDNFIARAWKDSLRRSWRDPNGPVKRQELNDAFRIVAEARRSRELWRLWDEEQTRGMSPEKAYSTLEVPMDVDEEMLITVYGMRVEDQPSQLDRMKSALQFIAEYTGSERLQRFLETGSDPGIIIAPARPDWPRGLNQLGNTCYLNSLLQYFYTIKDLREAIAPLAAASDKFVDDFKLKDDDLKHHRVGGRMVTRREVIRSRKFVSQLANLFYHLQWNDAPAITPSLELAKLALVTSKDEEEDDGVSGATDSSNSTDATLVEETVAHNPDPPKSASPPLSTPPSVLGKRGRGLYSKLQSTDRSTTSQHNDSFDEDDDLVVIPQAGSPTAEPGGASPMTLSSAEKTPARDFDGDIEMIDANEVETVASEVEPAKAPPLPPRRKHQASTSDMMFGKQHDVAECMDNCMFQIETGLLELGELAGPDETKRSVVKRLFYGKIRQRLTSEVELSRSKASVHEREDYFSHLPVNVSEESFDLHDGLSGYFEDVVEFEGRKAKMQVDIVELPPILQIQLQRVQFNRETLQPYKSHAYVKFGETISMDRFLHDALPEKKARSATIQAELNACRDRIHSLTQGKYAPYADSLKHVSKFLTEQKSLELPEVSGVLLDQVQKESQLVDDEISSSRARASGLKEQLEEVWQDEHRADYELTSVFVHRGTSPSFGHYFIYQRWLPDHPDEWFKYNDSDVTVVSKQEVLSDTTGSTANPYLLVFARKGSDIIRTVQREDPAVFMQT